ncbi:probable L-type lectin-domain containing receptor kinase II.1 [Pistacia vera]|uniref:probable L-type lectin-domain containing receptor kinase II.1 n=1 Tax=Pistacia vera TaxID=55513 RepID=UPI001262C519|nr:probable L-type lectin-domain containing receptor kinase II.1 [Pistacia vera]
MAAANRSLCFWVILNLSFISIAMAQDENQFFYHGFDEAKLHLDGTAKILPSGLLQLTNISELQIGHAFYPFPIKFNISSPQSLSFSTNFVFAIVPSEFDLSGHGMAFVISPTTDFSKAVASAYLGLFNISNNGQPTNHTLAVEIDTVRSGEFKDINGNHVGIDVNSLESIDSAPASYFSDKEGKNEILELASGNSIQIWIDYNGVEKLLNVTLAPIRTPKPKRPLLSKLIDLSEILLDSMYIGFSASTGTRKSDHYVLGWSFNESGQSQNLDISKLPSLPPTRKARVKTDPLIIVLPVAGLVVLTIIGGAVYIVRKKKYEEAYEDWEKEYGPHRISYKNLYEATKGFKDKELIGQGGFGKVYRGVLPSTNLQIAVKLVTHDSVGGMKQFVAEIVLMRRLRHRNLVRLLGYCRRKGELLLVYEYMPNGSLDKILYGNLKPNLNWFQRFRIIRGVASGLLYLHEEWEQIVLHRDIKPANVLLDVDLNGKLGDFGLARLYDHGNDPQTTNLVGTIGYLAPELLKTGKATTSTDVFAFGAFMLEVACGRRPMAMEPGEKDLVDWVTDFLKRGAIIDASDPRLEGIYVEKEMELVLKLGLYCSDSNPESRPSMKQVIQYLDGGTMLPNTPPGSIVIGEFTTRNEPPDNVVSFHSLVGSSSYTTTTNDSNLTQLIIRMKKGRQKLGAHEWRSNTGWIDYDGAEKLLNVTLSPIRIAKPERPLLSQPLNLSEVFLESMYVGFSAATGTITSDHIF